MLDRVTFRVLEYSADIGSKVQNKSIPGLLFKYAVWPSTEACSESKRFIYLFIMKWYMSTQ